MSELGANIDNLINKYREIFLKVVEEFNLHLEKMGPEEFKSYLNKDSLKEICEQQLKILENRKKFNCSGCAVCCKLACSEFSYEELNHKAQNNDLFAQQFTSIFIPYENEEEARKIYPEYFELLKERVKGENVYFYHCPKVTSENRCPDYDNRPQICKDFPDNPIGFLPKSCGYLKWREDSETPALILRALLEIIDFYKKKLSID